MRKEPSSAASYLARTIDAGIYAGVVALLGCLVSCVLGLLLLGSLTGVKFVLFLAGFFQIAVGVVQLWPTDVSDLEKSGAPNPDDISRVQVVVDRLAPIDRLGLPSGERFEHGVRQLAAGLLMLTISFGMETVLGITG